MDEDEIRQQKEYVDTLLYLLNEREDELNHSKNNYERAKSRYNVEKQKLILMKKEYAESKT